MAAVGGIPGGPAAEVRPEGEARVVGEPVSLPGVLELLERQGYRCALTGRGLTPQSAALDHVVPIRHGGAHVIENVQVLDKDVNRAKGSLAREEFIALCREVVRWCRRAEGGGGEAGS